MFERSKSKRRRRTQDESSGTDPIIESSSRSRSRSIPKRLLIPVWLLMISNFVFLIVGVFVMGANTEEAETESALMRNASETLYQQAIDDAAYTGPERVSHQLQPVEENYLLKWQTINEEKWVKVLLWTSEASFNQRFAALDQEKTYTSTKSLPTEFVTLVPQVQGFCQRIPNDENYEVDYRLKQYLGLNPNRRYERMVELWVPAQELFRPCPDPETSDRFCQIQPPRETVQVANIEDYPSFLRKLSLESYHPEGRPWTRLGYTYDWAYGQHGVGASEYMMIPGARFRFEGSYSTEEYCLKPGAKSPLTASTN